CQLGVTNDVDEQDMGDLQLDLFFDLGRHLVGALRLHEFCDRASARPTAQTAFIMAWCLLPDGSSSLLLYQFVYARGPRAARLHQYASKTKVGDSLPSGCFDL